MRVSNNLSTCRTCGAPMLLRAGARTCPYCAFEGALPSAENTRRSFGEYELLEEIGRGGMGIVYKARQKRLGRNVALKMVLSGRFADVRTVRRFQAEAEAAGSLQHPQIVTIYESGEEQGQVYFSMEYVAGRTLADIAGSGPIEAGRATRYVRLVAAATHFAHERGILHRDLKPSNILVDEFDQPRITDFGLAKRVDADARLTITGQVLGSPSFTAPEQARGQSSSIGPTADVYSLGAVLYFLLTGRPVFVANTLEETLFQVVHEEPIAPRLLNRSVPPDLETICLKCLRKAPEARYRSARELAEDLQRFEHHEPILARPVGRFERGWSWCRRKPMVASLVATVALLVLALLASALFASLRINRARDGEEYQNYCSSIALADQYIRTGDIERAIDVLLNCPDKFRHWEWGWCMAQCHQDALTVSTGHPGITNLTFSADETRLFVSSAGDVRNLRLATGELSSAGLVERISPEIQPISLSVEPRIDSRGRLTLHNGGGQIPLEGMPSARAIGSFLDVEGKRLLGAFENNIGMLWELPSGRQLGVLPARIYTAAFSSENQNIATIGGDNTIQLWKNLRPYRVLKKHTSPVRQIAFSSTGALLASADDRGVIRVWRMSAPPDVLVHGERFVGVSSAVASPDDRWIATTHWLRRAQLWDLETGQAVRDFKGHAQWVTQAAFDPVGQRLVTGSLDKTAKIWDVQIGEELVTLAGHEGGVSAVEFSRDGQAVFTASWDGAIRVWESRTGALLRQLRSHSHGVMALALNSTGSLLASASGDKKAILWDWRSGRMIHTLEGHTAELTGIAFSPSGEQVATSSFDRTLRIWEARSGRLLQILQGRAAFWSLAFSGDGLRIIAASSAINNTDGFPTVDIWDASTGRELLSLYGHSEIIFTVRFTRDSQKIISAGSDNTARQWEAFPWMHEAYGSTGATRETIDNYRRKFWMKRLRLAHLTEKPDPELTQNEFSRRFKWPAREGAATAEQIDLAGFYNGHLHFPWEPVRHWPLLNNDLSCLRPGVREYGGVKFDVRGIVQLRRTASEYRGIWNADQALLPSEVRGIRLGQKARKVHFLIGATYREDDGVQIGHFRMDYADRAAADVPIIYGDHVRGWWHGYHDPEVLNWWYAPDGKEGATQAEQISLGENISSAAYGSRVRVFKFTWPNPSPKNELESLDFVSDVTKAGPFLLAVTIEK